MRRRRQKEPKKTYYYKIRDTETGLFSCGGAHQLDDSWQAGWTRKGKIWHSIGALKNHLKQYKKIPLWWEVVQYEVQMNLVGKQPAVELHSPKNTED